MASEKSLPDDSYELLEAWLDRWEAAKDQGEPVSPEALCDNHPRLLPELKRRIRELEQVDRFLDDKSLSTDDEDPNAPFVEIQAGRYRAKKLHAPGGLGEVFYANDLELNREVALKRLRPNIAWSREARRRFVLEAEITGRLEHPGVVPVYGLGQDQAGNPYYAMRFIRGLTLDQATEDAHTGHDADADQFLQRLKSLLHAFRTACQTIAYAHDQGVLHRDIKPSNIILGNYGEVLVIDWGLAKVLAEAAADAPQSDDQQASSQPPSTSNGDPDETAAFQLDATAPGQIKGTPVYMSPEQAEGKAVTKASDIYSLGATLYKILAGKSPYTGDSKLTVLRKVREHDLIPPRQRNPAVPRALEAICLKAMHADPQQRYATALDLAQDVSRWLDDVPTTAWPEPWTIRTRRGLRKHRSIVVGIVAAFAVLLISAGAWAIRERTLNTQLTAALSDSQTQRTRAEEAMQKAQFQARRADTNYQEARVTVQKMLFRTQDPRWNNVPKLQQLLRDQSEVALEFFEDVAAQPGQDPHVRVDVAWGLIEAGKLQISLGNKADGKQKLRQAVVATGPLYENAKGDVEISLLRSDALLAYGSYLQGAEGTAAIQEGVAVLEAAWNKHPDALQLRGALIDGLITLGGALVNQKEYVRAETSLLRAIDLCQEILKATPHDTNRLAICARARVNLCAAYRHSQRGVEMKVQHDLAEQDFEKLLAADPLNRQVIDGLATLRVNGAFDLAAEGKKAEAIEYVNQNVPMLQAALQIEPNDASIRDRLYRTHGLAAMFLRDIGRTRAAAETWEHVVELAGPNEKSLCLVEATEYWLDAADLQQAIVAARRVSKDMPEMSPTPLWTRHATGLDRLLKLIAGDQELPTEERAKLTAELEPLAATARIRGKTSALDYLLRDALDLLHKKLAE